MVATLAVRRRFDVTCGGMRGWLAGYGQPDRIACAMATNNHSHLQQPKMDHIQPKNGPHNEHSPLGQKLLGHHGSDAPLRIGPSSHGSMAFRSNDLPSSSRAAQCPGYRVGNPGTSHTSFGHYLTGSSSTCLPEPAVNYPHRSEGFAPVSSHLDNRRAAVKRKNPIIHPADGIGAGGHYVGSSSSTQISNYLQPNPTPPTEPFHTQMPLSIGQRGWGGQQLIQQEAFQRNVRARQDRNISLEPRTASTYRASSIHLPSFRATASGSLNSSLERNQAPGSVPPSGAPGVTSGALMSPYYPAMGSSSSVAAVPTVHGSSVSTTFAIGGYAPRTVLSDTAPMYSHPSSAASSGARAMPYEIVIRSYPPASSAATSTSIRSGQPFPTTVAASSRHTRHVAVGHANNGRNRRARSSYYGVHPLMIEAQRYMMDHLVFYESRGAADPHRDMRLDVDNMSYEDLLALGEFIGNVNTGLADDKIPNCVREVVCCSSDPTQNEPDDGSCVVCLEDYKDKELLGILKCSHDFHADCIKKWLQVKNSCPVCKAPAA